MKPTGCQSHGSHSHCASGEQARLAWGKCRYSLSCLGPLDLIPAANQIKTSAYQIQWGLARRFGKRRTVSQVLNCVSSALSHWFQEPVFTVGHSTGSGCFVALRCEGHISELKRLIYQRRTIKQGQSHTWELFPVISIQRSSCAMQQAPVALLMNKVLLGVIDVCVGCFSKSKHLAV